MHHSKSSPGPGLGAWFRPASTSRHQRSKSPSGFTVRSAGGGSSSYSYTRARPRGGFFQRIIRKIQRFLREIFRYMKRHPIKVMIPLLTLLASGGVVQQLARRMGVPIPRAVMSMVGAGQSAKGGYDAWYGSQEEYGRRPAGEGGWLKGVLKTASMFM